MHDATIFVCENAECSRFLILIQTTDASALLTARLNGWSKAYPDRNLWLCERHG